MSFILSLDRDFNSVVKLAILIMREVESFHDYFGMDLREF